MMKTANVDRLLNELQRIRLLALVIHLILILAGGWLSWQLFLAVREKFLIEGSVMWSLATGAILLVLITRSLAIFRSNNQIENARRLDAEYHLRDRISTYVELRNSGHPFLNALKHDTERNLAGVSIIRVSQITNGATAPLVWSILLLLSIVCLPYLPVPDSVAAKKAEQSQIQRQARILERMVRNIQKDSPKLPELQKALQEIDKLSKNLQKIGIDKGEALKNLNAMQEQLQIVQRNLQQSLRKAAAKKAQKELSNGSKEGAGKVEQQQLEQLAKEWEKSLGSGNSKEGSQIKEAMQTGQFSKKQIERMKKAREEYQRDQKESEKILAQMQQALKNTQKGIAAQKRKVTLDSRLSERDMEKSKGGVEDGPGTTNLDIGPHTFDTKKKGKSEYTEDRTKAEFDSIYKGQREEVGKDPLYLQNQWTDNLDPKYTSIRSFGLNSDPKVTRSNAGTASQSAEESEIRKEKIPASFQEIVKDYFESIQE